MARASVPITADEAGSAVSRSMDRMVEEREFEERM